MMRKLFTLASAVSLLLCAATGVLWVHSFDRSEGIGYHTADGHLRQFRRYELWLESGNVSLWFDRWELTTSAGFDRFIESPVHWQGIRHITGRAVPLVQPQFWVRHDREGFQNWQLYPGQVRASADDIGFRIWVLVVVFAMPLIPIGWRLMRRHLPAHHPNRCKSCGYDLRASPDRCPECGAPIATKPEATA